MSDTPKDNLEPAMDKVAETLVPSRKKVAGSKEGDPAQSQILIRATKEDHELIKAQPNTKASQCLSSFVKLPLRKHETSLSANTR